MPIVVTTGGPMDNMAILSRGETLTYRDMVDQISDELDDTNDTYLPQIQNAVLAAIRFCAREPFYFNRNREAVLATKPGYSCYDARDNATLAAFGSIHAVYCEADGQIFALKREPAEDLELLAGSNVMMGLPCLYGFFGQKLCLYPVPDKIYTIRLLLNPAALPAIKSAAEASPWFTEAFDLIKARAKYDIYKDILKDAPLAAAAFNDFREQWAALQAETSRRAGAGRLRATQF
ncbi:hypothetical protein [Candidatus Tokpelaia sp.]|uniref:phage adaptor protein n=1 Tax=Candidatus Tokpelaia sp. TaxID=2233777 RepID=UPI00123BE14A|nr:hypothetical protein [Candidatus Tokpelaia sp.]